MFTIKNVTIYPYIICILLMPINISTFNDEILMIWQINFNIVYYVIIYTILVNPKNFVLPKNKYFFFKLKFFF